MRRETSQGLYFMEISIGFFNIINLLCSGDFHILLSNVAWAGRISY